MVQKLILLYFVTIICCFLTAVVVSLKLLATDLLKCAQKEEELTWLQVNELLQTKNSVAGFLMGLCGKIFNFNCLNVQFYFAGFVWYYK